MISVSLSMPTYFRASAWLYLQDRKVTAAVMTSHTPHICVHSKRGQPCTPVPIWLLPEVPVIKEKLLSRLDGPLGKDPYPVVSIHHHNCNQRDIIRDVQLQLKPGLTAFLPCLPSCHSPGLRYPSSCLEGMGRSPGGS